MLYIKLTHEIGFHTTTPKNILKKGEENEKNITYRVGIWSICIGS